MIVDYHPAFAEDLIEGIRYHNLAVPGLGEDFRKEVFQTIDRIKTHPCSFSKVCVDVYPASNVSNGMRSDSH